MRALLFLPCLALSGCSGAAAPAPDAGPPDLSLIFPPVDLSPGDDLAPCENACGDCTKRCGTFALGPCANATFPLKDDGNDPRVESDGVTRNERGELRIGPRPSFGHVFITNPDDWGHGTVSKVSSSTLAEVARYPSVTCASTPNGSRKACDGVNGCCAIDDVPRYEARKNPGPGPPRQGVQLVADRPWRTAVDWTGDVWVLNRAPGGTPSVTKIANDPGWCRDRNKNGRIDTSNDADKDGLIQTDCNDDGVEDDVASVQARPCLDGKKQEYFGLDDECVILTANVGLMGEGGRAVAPGPGASDTGPSDVWVAAGSPARVHRVDGTTGLMKEDRWFDARCAPNGMVIDSYAIGWTVPDGTGSLCFFDTKSAWTGPVHDPPGGALAGWGISLDRDQNVWAAGGASPSAWRYSPDRAQKLAGLDKGTWLTIANAGRNGGATGAGRGIAADSRSNMFYFTWLTTAGGQLVRLPASTLPAGKSDAMFDAANEPVAMLPGVPTGVGVTADRDLALTIPAQSAVVLVPADNTGMTLAPRSRSLIDNAHSTPGSDAYADFTGFGLRNIQYPAPTWSYVVTGCLDGNGAPATTHWKKVAWQSDLPAGTALRFHARTGDVPRPDVTWSFWGALEETSPADLQVLAAADSRYIQIEVIFNTQDRTKTPVLKCLEVAYQCD